jgi:sulfate/thiosulfate transport system ATP-binding protein
MITVTNATKRFGDFVALDDVSLEVPDGSLTALLGPSGSGKSTLLRIIGGLETADSGTVTIHDEDVTNVAPQRRGIGFVFQHYAAFKHMTVRDNVGFGLKIRKTPKARIDERVDELLRIVGLAGFAKRYPNQLSGGQRQRMALARALAVEPKVLLLDEPFGALDAKVRAELREWLRRLHDEVHVTTLLVTHDRPANRFVMGFLGPVAQLDGTLVRPHDIAISPDPEVGGREAQVHRVSHLGFEVRVELLLEQGEPVFAQLTRTEAEELDLTPGDIVWLRTPAGGTALVA